MKAEKVKSQGIETRNQSEQAINISSESGSIKNAMDLIAIEMINELQEEAPVKGVEETEEEENQSGEML